MNRGGKILGVALVGATATCVDHPSAPPSRQIPTAVTAATAPPPAISYDSLTSGSSNADQSVYTTASISPIPNTLVTVAVLAHSSSRATASPTLSGGGMPAWTEVASVTFDGVGKPHKRLSMFRAMSPAPGSGPLTITFTKTQSNCEWIVLQWRGVDSSGVNGAGAIARTGSARADAATSLTVALAKFGSASDVAYGVFGVASAGPAVTPGPGFTEISEPSAEGSDLEVEWATNDSTIDATWATANAGALAVELRAARSVDSVGVTPTPVSIPVGGAVQLTATAYDAARQPISGSTFTWKSDPADVATLSTSGLVTGLKPGDATITATTGGTAGTAIVHVTTPITGDPAVVGQWDGPFPSGNPPIVQVHLHLLPDGRVLSYGDGSDGPPLVWDPATGTFTAVSSPSLVFCAGHDFLPDGRLLVAGGGSGSKQGLTNSNIFDYRTTSWQAEPRMAEGRWYPTTTTLPNGEVLTLAGENNSGTASIPEVWNGAAWRQLTTANLVIPYYPRAFVAPDGRVFTAGTEQQSRYLDVAGTGSWTNGPLRKFGDRPYGPAVMYEPGKILYAGGGDPPTNTAEVIDLNQSNPQWTYTGSMAYARWNSNATVLPTGDVLVAGGTSLGDRTNPAGAVNAAELWNPTAGTWTTLASSNKALRGYHSTSLLLPDGRVLHSGGGDCCGVPDVLSYELYSPLYLFKSARPVVTGVAGTVGYGNTLTLTVQTPGGYSIAKVTLIRFGSVTHAFDQSQRLVPIAFSQAGGDVSVTLPASRTVAPPGPYMLFVVDGNGVPSVGRIVLLQ